MVDVRCSFIFRRSRLTLSISDMIDEFGLAQCTATITASDFEVVVVAVVVVVGRIDRDVGVWSAAATCGSSWMVSSEGEIDVLDRDRLKVESEFEVTVERDKPIEIMPATFSRLDPSTSDEDHEDDDEEMSVTEDGRCELGPSRSRSRSSGGVLGNVVPSVGESSNLILLLGTTADDVLYGLSNEK